MTTIEKYQELSNKIDKYQRNIDRAEGSLNTLLEKLKADFKCNDITTAKTLLTKLQKEAGTAEKKLQTDLDAFEDKWGDILND